MGRVLGLGVASIDRLEAGLGDLRRTTAFVRGRLLFSPRADDIYVATYPRSGTTWMLFMLHLLVRGADQKSVGESVGGPDPGFRHIGDVCPWFERALAIGSLRAEDLERLPSPRIFKTHLPPQWLPPVGRFVVIVRDPADVALSYYGLYRDYLGFEGSLDEFLVRFERGRVQYGSWWTHVGQWQRRATDDLGAAGSVVLLRYEELRADPAAGLRRVAAAVGLPTDAQSIEAAVQGASLERMKQLESRFDHATALLLERGVSARRFIGRGAMDGARRLSTEQRARLQAAGCHASEHHAPWELPAFLH